MDKKKLSLLLGFWPLLSNLNLFFDHHLCNLPSSEGIFKGMFRYAWQRLEIRKHQAQEEVFANPTDKLNHPFF